MNELIVNNLLEFWTFIGLKTNRLNETPDYKTVSMADSDWPNRVFSISKNPLVINKIIRLSQEDDIPDIITLSKPNTLAENPFTEFLFGQKNMALDLTEKAFSRVEFNNIHQVVSEDGAASFAKTATEAFGYRVDSSVVYTLCESGSGLKMFNYLKNNEFLGCGIIFLDSNKNAGLHMIGTLPKARNQGIGKIMTEKLLSEAISSGSKKCMLHASLMGEAIYRKLGFSAFGEIETYRILKSQRN